MRQIIDKSKSLVGKDREWHVSRNESVGKLPHTPGNLKYHRMPRAEHMLRKGLWRPQQKWIVWQSWSRVEVVAWFTIRAQLQIFGIGFSPLVFKVITVKLQVEYRKNETESSRATHNKYKHCKISVENSLNKQMNHYGKQNQKSLGSGWTWYWGLPHENLQSIYFSIQKLWHMQRNKNVWHVWPTKLIFSRRKPWHWTY